MHARLLTLALAATFALVACDDSPTTPPVDPPKWAAQLEAQGDDGLEGVVTVDANAEGFDATIQVTGAADEAEYLWHLGLGTDCAQTDARIGEAEDYPTLVGTDTGEASAETWIGAALEPDEDYHVAVWRVAHAEANGDDLVACGALARVD